jgi:uDENN domain
MVLVTAAVDTGQTSPELKKKTRLETSNVKDAGLRRLVEYFVVVSSVPNASSEGAADIQESVSFEGSRDGLAIDDDEDIYIDDFDFQPKITARFPPQDHQENPLHESVTFFCYPSGSIQLRMEKSMPKVGHLTVHSSLAELALLQRPQSPSNRLFRTTGIIPRRIYPTVGS